MMVVSVNTTIIYTILYNTNFNRVVISTYCIFVLMDWINLFLDNLYELPFFDIFHECSPIWKLKFHWQDQDRQKSVLYSEVVLIADFFGHYQYNIFYNSLIRQLYSVVPDLCIRDVHSYIITNIVYEYLQTRSLRCHQVWRVPSPPRRSWTLWTPYTCCRFCSPGHS